MQIIIPFVNSDGHGNPCRGVIHQVFTIIELLTISVSVIWSSNDIFLIPGTICIAGWNFGLFFLVLMVSWSINKLIILITFQLSSKTLY